MDLDLSSIDTPAIITATIENILEAEDLAALASRTANAADDDAAAAEVDDILTGLQPSDEPGSLKKLRERHHSVARLMASGLSQSLVAAMAGYTPSYLSILLNNPAMKELVELYRIQNGAGSQVIGEKLRSIAMQSVEEIESRLRTEAGRKAMSVQDLATVGKLGLDRSGHGPTSTQHVVREDHLLDHARIAELSQRARASSSSLIVPVREVRAALALPKPRDDAAEPV